MTVNGGPVLVTGGSGFIAGWCSVTLLSRGYTVRATIRDRSREAEVTSRLQRLVDTARLTFHEADLLHDDGWDAAAVGCEYVLHVASPLSVVEPRDPNDMITPARDGTARVINAAIRARVSRVVLTSSVAATSRPAEDHRVADESVWTNLDAPGVTTYMRAKTLAERAAWELIAAAGGSTTLATIHPSLVVGPVLDRDYADSVHVIERLLTGGVPGLPRLGFNFVDVRDVADLHVLAMTAPHAAGHRFIAANQWCWIADVADMLRTTFGQEARKVPTRRLPDIVFKMAAVFDRELAAVAADLGVTRDYSSEKARTLLGWQTRHVHDTLVDCARSLMQLEADEATAQRLSRLLTRSDLRR